jgi:hypothetical protein
MPSEYHYLLRCVNSHVNRTTTYCGCAPPDRVSIAGEADNMFARNLFAVLLNKIAENHVPRNLPLTITTSFRYTRTVTKQL